MDETYQKFAASKQEPLRLSIAAEGWLAGKRSSGWRRSLRRRGAASTFR